MSYHNGWQFSELYRMGVKYNEYFRKYGHKTTTKIVDIRCWPCTALCESHHVKYIVSDNFEMQFHLNVMIDNQIDIWMECFA